jgi:hypothetical protein
MVARCLNTASARPLWPAHPPPVDAPFTPMTNADKSNLPHSKPPAAGKHHRSYGCLLLVNSRGLQND